MHENTHILKLLFPGMTPITSLIREVKEGMKREGEEMGNHSDGESSGGWCGSYTRAKILTRSTQRPQ